MTSRAGSFAFEIETDSVVGPRVLYTIPPAGSIRRGLWSEEIEEAAAVVGYEVDWRSQVAVGSGRFAALLVAALTPGCQIERRNRVAAAAVARLAAESEGDEREALRWAAGVLASIGAQCTCTPGLPRPSGVERVEDLVTLDASDDPEHARLVREAAQAALDAGVEAGPRRARWIDGWLAGRGARS